MCIYIYIYIYVSGPTYACETNTCEKEHLSEQNHLYVDWSPIGLKPMLKAMTGNNAIGIFSPLPPPATHHH